MDEKVLNEWQTILADFTREVRQISQKPPVSYVANFVLFLWYKVREIVGMDRRSIAFWRILIAITTLWDLGDRARDLKAHYTDDGFMPRYFVLESFWNWEWTSVYMVSGTVWFTTVVFCLNAAVNVLLLIGYYSRTSAAVSYLFLLGIQDRNILVGHAGDILHRMALLIAPLLPIGDYWSVDAALALRDKRQQPPVPKKTRNPHPHLVANFTTFALMLQVLVMYYTAYFHKSGREWNDTGTATWLALQLDFFRRDPYGDFLLSMPALCKFLTISVHEWQMIGCYFFFWPICSGPAKFFGVLGYFAMHMGFALCLRLGQFAWVTCVCVLVMIPPWFWDTIVCNPWIKSRARTDVRIFYRKDCRFCHTLACVTHTFTMFEEVRIVGISVPTGAKAAADTASEHEDFETRLGRLMQQSYGWLAVQDHNRKLHVDWSAVVAILRASPFLFPLASLFDRLSLVGEVWMEVVHQHPDPNDPAPLSLFETYAGPQYQKMHVKKRLSRRLAKWAVYGSVFLAVQYFSAFLCYVIVTWNCGNLGWYGWYTPNDVRWAVRLFHLDQYWGVFAPRPPDSFWWYNFESILDNGTKVELFDKAGYMSLTPQPWREFNKPDPFYIAFKNHRWFKYYENGFNSHPQRDALRLNFGRWLCREWNGHKWGDQRLWKFTIHIVTERVNYETMDGFHRIPTGSARLWDHICYNEAPSFQVRQQQDQYRVQQQSQNQDQLRLQQAQEQQEQESRQNEEKQRRLQQEQQQQQAEQQRQAEEQQRREWQEQQRQQQQQEQQQQQQQQQQQDPAPPPPAQYEPKQRPSQRGARPAKVAAPPGRPDLPRPSRQGKPISKQPKPEIEAPP